MTLKRIKETNKKEVFIVTSPSGTDLEITEEFRMEQILDTETGVQWTNVFYEWTCPATHWCDIGEVRLDEGLLSDSKVQGTMGSGGETKDSNKVDVYAAKGWVATRMAQVIYEEEGNS